MRKGLRMVVVVGLVGQLCVPVYAHGQAGWGLARLIDILIDEAVAALIVESAGVMSEALGEAVFGYCGARWSGGWLRLCERHNEIVSDLQRERRLALDDIEFRFANEVPDVVRARCESGTQGDADGIDRDCLREEVDREKEREMRGLRGAFTEQWEAARSRFMRDCDELARRHPDDVPEELPWSCR